ncbi:hypothetical protein [Romboutsia lituseburensis]|uniref:hypothetical protein n=1 Tax=Romboutsia lituseburensis TaxID=1537 RepID=UPI00215B6A51|nr:hypothetical protein [Romboutsia lituseburensis]MCR8746992.1 hypothetical protein [Romboutsia lituseburensis]
MISNLKNTETTIRFNKIYDSIVAENKFNLGYYSKNDYIIIRFIDFKNQEDENITEF